MAGFQPGAAWRVGPFNNGDDDDDGDIHDWIAQRNAAMAIKQQADAAGRQTWADGIRNGQDVQAPNPSDVTAVGMRKVTHGRLSHRVGDLPRFGPAQRFLYGTPAWSKAGATSAVGHSVAAGEAYSDEDK